MAKILVTGASGFVGRHLVPALEARGHAVVEAGRRRRSGAAQHVAISDIGPETDWSGKLEGMDCVIHLAGLAHRKAPDEQFHAVNDQGTERLVDACRSAGVGAFVLLSSIAARKAEQLPREANAYGRSKLASERHVLHAAELGSLTGIILRPPMIYGHDAPGNWHRLQRLAAGSLPLPFGSVHNRRSHCSIDNLCSAIVSAVEEGVQGSGVYEIADEDQVSLAETLELLRDAMGKKAALLPVPVAILRAALAALGQKKLVESLLDDLQLDPSPFMRAFNWKPPEKAKEAIRKSGRLFAKSSESVA
ncbi:UDP-glucose 4-epimerase [Nitratireductor aestuarii]|uniref:UDP-glucose 4-epimerase n=1 Tax=Nitratireductor aestuarii TaxID=1735103 RepID=A0A916W274_9HYPH|nr:NAD-dependent epimerase/dehydratase family protein [Nitratireductor aestuarii]GGA61540.1 UDP-glucose 4-epimerase [Nitratireductor aestuarii]